MTNNATTRVGLLIEPLDTLFFRDGRPFEEGARTTSVLPAPQTVAGALRTWLLRQAGHNFTAPPAKENDTIAAIRQVRFRGPWFALKTEGEKAPEPLVPAPATLHQVENSDEIIRLDPLKEATLPGWVPPEPGMLPLWRRDIRPTKRLNGYLTRAGVEAFLKGGVPSKDDIKSAEDLFEFDHRTGIAIDQDTLAAEERRIYAVSLMVLKPGVSLYVEALGTNEALRSLPHEPVPIPLGGEGRRVTVRKVDAIQWPEPHPTADRKPLLLLTTPGLFDRNDASHGNDTNRRKAWRPDMLTGNLVAAAVPGHVAFSGWDFSRAVPKPNRFAVAAGSVYFLKQPLEPRPESLYTDRKDELQGWGTYLEGVWDYV